MSDFDVVNCRMCYQDFERPWNASKRPGSRLCPACKPWRKRQRAKAGEGERIQAHLYRDVVAAALGHDLPSHWQVHHLNGLHEDNRLENLKIWVVPHPAGQRPEDLVRWVVKDAQMYRGVVGWSDPDKAMQLLGELGKLLPEDRNANSIFDLDGLEKSAPLSKGAH